jgi:hypothetical protein
VLAIEALEDGYTIVFLEQTVPLRAEHGEIMENAGNAWFQPVPSAECLEELAEAIDLHLEEAENLAAQVFGNDPARQPGCGFCSLPFPFVRTEANQRALREWSYWY